jgi:tyrosyl-DNA phosphodiesterase 2
MHVLAGLLRLPGRSGGIIAGDFNPILPEDHTLVDEYELVDPWVTLHGSTTGPGGGATWGVGVQLEDGIQPGRLGKVVVLACSLTRLKSSSLVILRRQPCTPCSSF